MGWVVPRLVLRPRPSGAVGPGATGVEGLSLRQALVLASLLTMILPLLLAVAALTGFAEVQRSHALAGRLTTAREFQVRANALHDELHGDVLEAVLESRDNNESAVELTARTRSDAAQLTKSMQHLDDAQLPATIASDARSIGVSLQAYGAQAIALTELAQTNPVAAQLQLASFDQAFDDLTPPQAELTKALTAAVDAADAKADRRRSEAVWWTVAISAVTVLALLVLASFLHRVGRRNEELLGTLGENAQVLASTNDQLEAAQRLARVGSWQFESATRDLQMSAEFYRILGIEPDAPGDRLALLMERIHPEDRAHMEEVQRQAAASPRDIRSEYRIVRPDGSIREVRALGHPVHDESGALVRLVGTAQDVTEQRMVERMKDEFVSVISHELRTPLTSIRGALGLLAGGAVGPLPPKAQRMADVAMNSSQRLVRLVNDILDVEKMAAGKLELDLASVPASELVAAAIEEMRAMADGAGVTVLASPTSEVVLADRDRLLQTLTNLISNAIKFSPSGASVSVAASALPVEAGGRRLVQFDISDHGSGIPEDKLETIFDRFTQADASDTRAKQGTGLGLPICRGIVQQHGGRIWATSVDGEGTTFSFTVPSAAASVVTSASEPLPVGAVLICDDDPDVVEVLAAMLENHGYATLRAHSGPQALALATDQAPSLILMDLRMPGMSGWETIASPRSEPTTADIPIVIFSALGPDDIAVPAASSWLTKPVDQAELMKSLRQALGTGATTSVLVVEDDEGLGEVLQTFFTDHGVHARVAHTGSQALSMCREVPPDLVVLDLGLPDIDGYEVVDVLRRDERLRSLPLLVYTGARLDAADRSRLRLGETRFVSKADGAPDEFERQVIALLEKVTASS